MATGIFFPDEFIPVMQAELYREPGVETVLDQFVMEINDLQMKPGDTKRVLGPQWLAKPANPLTDRKLASIQDKVSDNAAQNPTIVKQEISIDEYLLPDALIVQEFEAAHSFHDLAQMNGVVLARDYFVWRDEMIKKRMLDSTFVRRAGGKADDASMTLSDRVSLDELVYTATDLKNRNIPTYSDGRYICVVGPNTEATLMTEQKFLDASTEALREEAPLFRGSLGTVAGIRFIRSNNIDTKTVGTNPNDYEAEQVIMFGTSNFGMHPLGSAEGIISQKRMSFLSGQGAGPIVGLRGMPVEVRLREVTDYGRFQEMIWIEHSGYSVLDPHVASYAGKTVGTDSSYIQILVGASALS